MRRLWCYEYWNMQWLECWPGLPNVKFLFKKQFSTHPIACEWVVLLKVLNNQLHRACRSTAPSVLFTRCWTTCENYGKKTLEVFQSKGGKLLSSDKTLSILYRWPTCCFSSISLSCSSVIVCDGKPAAAALARTAATSAWVGSTVSRTWWNCICMPCRITSAKLKKARIIHINWAWRAMRCHGWVV